MPYIRAIKSGRFDPSKKALATDTVCICVITVISSRRAKKP